MSESKMMATSELVNYHQMKADVSSRISPYASIIGDVTIGANCAVLAGAHIRGDVAPITIGDETTVQENCVFHVSTDCPLIVGDHVNVGHGAILHGCTIEKNVLVGMGSIVMDGAVIPENCVIGAGALITQGKVFPPASLIVGSPAKAVRQLSYEEVNELVTSAVDDYLVVTERMLDEGVLSNPALGDDIWPSELVE